MLKARLCSVLAAVMLVACVPALAPSIAVAECTATAGDGHSAYDGDDVTVVVGCRDDSGSSQEAAPSGEGGAPTAGSAPACTDWDGTEVPCWDGDNFWSEDWNAYCHYIDLPQDSPLWDSYRDADGQPTATPYQCTTGPVDAYGLVYWEDSPVSTPGKPGVDPATAVRSAVASLGLHPPTVGVGAFVYPGYEEWGLTWWVGAPMWLWVDASDSLQWGAHTISASEGGLTITATAAATSVVFDTGDGAEPVTCLTPGTVRPWDPDDLLSHHSPTKCEHAYMTINTLGDKNSRFTVSATVTWTVDWSTTDGQAGTLTTQVASTDNPAIHVGEIHSVLVANPGQ